MPDDAATERQLQALRDSLAAAPAALPIGALLPVLVPASFFERDHWVGPHESIGIAGVGLTWAFEQPAQTMHYLSYEAARQLDAQGIDWRESAFDNLSERSENFFTGQFLREDGSAKVFAAVFMHEDGFGPSRLLFDETLEELFPEGYRVALPEMSCAVALSAAATPDEVAKIEDIVKHCYERGTRPLIPGLHPPLDLA